MTTPSETTKPTAVMSKAPATTYSNLIVRYAHKSANDFAFFYAESAKRLAGTFKGKPEDDTILLPFLYLYRQAVELRLKSHISSFATTRMMYTDGETPDLKNRADAEWVRQKYWHNLHKLLNETKEQYEALSSHPFPADVEKFVLALHEDDEAGVSFRYAGNLPNIQESADFPKLAAWLETGYDNLSLLEDEIYGIYSAAPTLSENAGV